jgi:8-oxo-dGTP diphosphatase
VVYDAVAAAGGFVQPAAGAGRRIAAADLPGLPLTSLAATVLGVTPPATAVPATLDGVVRSRGSGPWGVGESSAPRVQRTGAYALILDEDRVLLSRYAGTGRWSLPGGGIDHGEQPVEALHREVREETGLTLRRPRLLGVDSIRFTGRAPDGRLEDFHGVRIIYGGRVCSDAAPEVLEVDGTTDAVAWIRLDELERTEITELVRRAMALTR